MRRTIDGLHEMVGRLQIVRRLRAATGEDSGAAVIHLGTPKPEIHKQVSP